MDAHEEMRFVGEVGNKQRPIEDTMRDEVWDDIMGNLDGIQVEETIQKESFNVSSSEDKSDERDSVDYTYSESICYEGSDVSSAPTNEALDIEVRDQCEEVDRLDDKNENAERDLDVNSKSHEEKEESKVTSSGMKKKSRKHWWLQNTSCEKSKASTLTTDTIIANQKDPSSDEKATDDTTLSKIDTTSTDNVTNYQQEQTEKEQKKEQEQVIQEKEQKQEETKDDPKQEEQQGDKEKDTDNQQKEQEKQTESIISTTEGNTQMEKSSPQPVVNQEEKTSTKKNTPKKTLDSLLTASRAGERNENKSSMSVKTSRTTRSTRSVLTNKSMKGKRRVEFRHQYPFPQQSAGSRQPDLIVKDNTRVIAKKTVNLTKPKPQVEELIQAVQGKSITRRSNACGTVKLLASKKKNQIMLARVEGLLDALVFAINTNIQEYGEEFQIALNARTRAVTALLHLSEPKENRQLVFDMKGLPESLLKLIQSDAGEARFHACSTLAILAKTECNREKMAQTKNLFNVLSKVVRGICDQKGLIQVEPIIPRQNKDTDQNNDSINEKEPEAKAKADGTVSDEDLSCKSDCENAVTLVESHKNSDMDCAEDDFQLKEAKFEEHLVMARLHSCAALLHLSRHCSISDTMCKNEAMIRNICAVSYEIDNPVHTKCLETICHLTRFPSNNTKLAQMDFVIEALKRGGKSQLVEDRIWCVRMIQNISSDASSKTVLATGPILEMLSSSAMRKDPDEQIAAVSAIANISTEPGAIVPLTNTKNVVATLVHLAHNLKFSDQVRRLACEALASIALWLQTLAAAGTVPECVDSRPLPTLSSTGYLRWDSK